MSRCSQVECSVCDEHRERDGERDMAADDARGAETYRIARKLDRTVVALRESMRKANDHRLLRDAAVRERNEAAAERDAVAGARDRAFAQIAEQRRLRRGVEAERDELRVEVAQLRAAIDPLRRLLSDGPRTLPGCMSLGPFSHDENGCSPACGECDPCLLAAALGALAVRDGGRDA